MLAFVSVKAAPGNVCPLVLRSFMSRIVLWEIWTGMLRGLIHSFLKTYLVNICLLLFNDLCLTHWSLGDLDLIFKMKFSMYFYRFPDDNALRWMSQYLTGDRSTLIQVMAWCCQAPIHYLNQCWPRYISNITSLGHNELMRSWLFSQFGNHFICKTYCDDLPYF